MAKQQAVEEEYDYTKYLEKEPTDLQKRFSDWIIEKVGIQFGTKKETDAFKEGVRLATALRMPFQRSPENQEASPMVRANRGSVAPKKSVAKKASKAAEDDEETSTKPARGKRSVRREPAEAPAKPVRRPARRRAAATTDDEATEAPF